MRIAHFSDLHLLSLKGARPFDFANKRWIGGANLLASRARHHRPEVFRALVDDLIEMAPDHVVCTGDISNLGLEQEFVFAREHFDRIPLGPAGVTVVPGNHDAYVAKGAEYFNGYFSGYHDPDDQFAYPNGGHWPVVRVRGEVAIIGLSSSRTTPWFTAYGRLGTEQIDRLHKILSDPRIATRFRLVALHHRPAGEGSGSRIRGLKDRTQLLSALSEHGAELVLHGHEHQDVAVSIAGPGGRAIPIRGIQSGSYEAGRPKLRARYRIYEVDSSAAENPTTPSSRPTLVGETLRVWDPESQKFVADAAR